MPTELPDSAGQYRQKNNWRARGENLLLSAWYPADRKSSFAALLSLVLLPLSWLYTAIATHRAKTRCVPGFATAKRPDALLVVVGNITVGGTGKTPFLLKLVNELQRRDVRCVVLSRGYGGLHAAQSRLPRWVSIDDAAVLVGDEPLEIARAIARMTGSASPAVMICRNRRRGLDAVLAERARAALRCDVILSDDGLQHYAMPRDIEFALVDGARGFGNRRMLPAGPLREPLTRLSQCDCLVVNGEPTQQLAGLDAARMTVAIASLRTLAPSASEDKGLPIAAGNAGNEGNEGKEENGAACRLASAERVIAVAALGNPQRFFDSVAMLLASAAPSATLHCRAFADHHAFALDDFLALQRELTLTGIPANKAVFILTGKDAVKCEPFAAALPLPCLVAEAGVTIDDAALQPVFDGLEKLQQWRTARKGPVQANHATGASV
ncbi:MAG: tetraacyldisaccharide 4'-kinase [Pseudomonadales bacterium]